MHSVRIFVRLWAGFAIVVVAYGCFDRALNPWLATEESFIMKPDLTRILDLMHWGGRLWHLNMPLLALNALLIGGALSLVALWAIQLLRRAAPAQSDRERISIFVAEARPSSPPSR